MRRCLLAILALVLVACAARAPRFAAGPPVERLDDTRPIPVPPSTEYDLTEYYVRSLLRHPVREGLSFSPPGPAQDVNSMDQVPSSSWYNQRLGYRPLTPAQLLAGPRDAGPPVAPVTVVTAKVGGGNPGFIIADARGVKYIVKFDPPEFPAIETTTALVVNRLFWAFGYNVPEDDLFFFRPEELTVASAGELTRADVDAILALVAPPVDGVYRSTVSRFLSGRILGPFPEHGVRPGDGNDRIPHQHRRALRALRVFCAFTNHSDIRPDNSLDVYLGEPGHGHVKHYLLDFGEAFGGHGAEHGRPWDGYEPAFGFERTTRNLVSLGVVLAPWESVAPTPWLSVGSFEAQAFEARDWHETWPYLPIRSSRPEDDYWAAKIVGALTPAHLQALVQAARYPENGAENYVLATLLERRRKVLETFLYAVTPVDAVACSGNRLHLRDSARAMLGEEEAQRRYDVTFRDERGRRMGSGTRVNSGAADFDIVVPGGLLAEAGGYLRLDVRAWRGATPLPMRGVRVWSVSCTDPRPRANGWAR